jgi:4,5-dihydroxyphthalate decarboxylase
LSRLTLSAALSGSLPTRPLLDGEVEVEGVELIPSRLHGSEMFWRQLRFGDFDVSELSLSSLLKAHAQGDRTWTAIPVFTTRRFFHTEILVRSDRRICVPADLVGKRVGVPEYQQTAALWTRGALLHEFGVRPQDLVWFMERNPERSHGGATGFAPPPGVQLSYIPPASSIGEMLESGELDAALHYLSDHNLVDRSRQNFSASSAVRYLFADRRAEALRYYTATGIFPINHTVVVRTELLAAHPWLALNLFGAFSRAKALIHARLLEALQPWTTTGGVAASVAAALEADPLAYGLAATGKVLDTLADPSFEQGLTPSLTDPRELFHVSTRDL